jgi:hypothetical protein
MALVSKRLQTCLYRARWKQLFAIEQLGSSSLLRWLSWALGLSCRILRTESRRPRSSTRSS